MCSAFVDEALIGEITDQARRRNGPFSSLAQNGDSAGAIQQRIAAGVSVVIGELIYSGGICVREMAELFCDVEYQVRLVATQQK